MMVGVMQSSFLPGVLLLVLGLPCYAGVPDFHLRDTTGAMHSSAEWAGHKAVLLYFTTVDCPVANSYVPEMNRIHDAYAPRGVLFLAVEADVTVPEPEVVRYATDFRYSFPVVMDPRQVLVQLTGASLTPQAAVLSSDGKLLYLGRVDNRVEDFGQQRINATVFDLRDALDAVLAGKPVARPVTKSIGCAINRVGGSSK